MNRPAILSLLMCAVAGCSSSKVSHTPRTATEQMLISNAVDQSLANIDFAPFAGRRVFLEEKYMDSVDKSYILASVRHQLMRQGCTLADKKEDSEITIEARSGGVGTDSNELFVGIPEVTVPGMLTLPEVRLVNRNSLTGTAKIGLVAYSSTSGEAIGEGGLSLAQSDRNDWFVLGVGPYQNGSLKTEVQHAESRSSFTPKEPIPHYVAFEHEYDRPTSPEAGRIRLTSEELNGAR